MKLEAFAESVAFLVNKEEDLGYRENLKFKILGYRASIIADRNAYYAPEIYYQYLKDFKVDSNKDIFDKSFELINIPKLISFKDGRFAIKAFNKVGVEVKSIDILTLEQAEFINGRKFTKGFPYLLLDGNTLIARNFKLSSLNGLMVGGIFNNPLDIPKLESCSSISECIEEDDLEIEDNLYQKIMIFLSKELGIENINEIKPSNK
jgi:hypothetical protein